ncbi:unnamed protein product [Caenorhabditis brenneri]
MDTVKPEQYKSMLKEAVQECLLPLEEKMERRLRILEKIIDEKADKEEEAGPVEPKIAWDVLDFLRQEVHFGWQIAEYISKPFVISPFSIILGLFPIYNKANAETRLAIRKYLLKDVNQRVMEEYFFNLSGLTGNSEIAVTKRGNNLHLKSTPSIAIHSYFAQQYRNNSVISSHFYTSPTLKRNQEFITLAPSEHYYHNCNHAQLQMIKIQMEGDNDGYLHVFLPKDRYSLVEFMSRLNSANLSLPVSRSHLKRVKIILPVFSMITTSDMKNILEKMAINRYSIAHGAQFQLNQSGVNVPHVPTEENSSEPEKYPENGETLEFLANRPFLFMLTKSNHVMYMGWYQ